MREIKMLNSDWSKLAALLEKVANQDSMSANEKRDDMIRRLESHNAGTDLAEIVSWFDGQVLQPDVEDAKEARGNPCEVVTPDGWRYVAYYDDDHVIRHVTYVDGIPVDRAQMAKVVDFCRELDEENSL